MRSFAYKNDNFEKDSYTPQLVEGNPCYQASAYDSVMYDETPNIVTGKQTKDRKSTRLNSSHSAKSRMPSSA